MFNVEPDLIREGGTIPIAKTFEDVTGKSIIMMPIGGFDDGLHSQNEKMSRLALQCPNTVCIKNKMTMNIYRFLRMHTRTHTYRRINSVLFLFIGLVEDILFSLTHSFPRYNYIEGTKLFIAYLHEVAHLKKD